MSRTRTLMEALRDRLGAAEALPPPPPPEPIPEPPARIFPKRHGLTPFARAAAEHTTALLGIDHVGTRYLTDVVLQVQAELAVAHGAVAAVLPEDFAAKRGLLDLHSRVRDHHEHLLRPDLGRRLAEESAKRLIDSARKGPDVQPILADGLSATACEGSGLELLQAFTRSCEARGLTVGTPMLARFARVWLEDEIGELVGAKVAAILLGERPGLGTGDGLSAYLVYQPKLGKTDGDRNMVSNIHPRGTPPAEAAEKLALIASAMIAQRRSGVSLDLSALRGALGEAGGFGYRAPQRRVRLVEVP